MTGRKIHLSPGSVIAISEDMTIFQGENREPTDSNELIDIAFIIFFGHAIYGQPPRRSLCLIAAHCDKAVQEKSLINKIKMLIYNNKHNTSYDVKRRIFVLKQQ